MKYYSYEINYDEDNGSMGVIAVERKLTVAGVLKRLQKEGEVESFAPRDFDAWEIEKSEYNDEMGIDPMDEIKKMPAKTLDQKKKRAVAILEHYNDEYDNPNSDDDRDDRNYMEGLRDGYSRALNDLFGLGN